MGSTSHLAQSSGQLILFPSKRPIAGTTVVSAEASPRGPSAAIGPEQKQQQHQLQKLQKQGKAAANMSAKSAGKKAGTATSGPATALSTPMNFSPGSGPIRSPDNTIGDHTEGYPARKGAVVGSRAAFQHQVHHPKAPGSATGSTVQAANSSIKPSFK